MKRVYLLSAVLLGLIIVGPIMGPNLFRDNTYDVWNRFGPFRMVIVTDKEAYTLGEKIDASFLVINDAAFPIFIKPLNEISVSGNSVNNPEKSSIGIDSLPEKNFRIEIPAYGNSSILRTNFKPQYPGEFVIKWMGVKKTVDVTGYKEVSLNSTGISLEVQTSQTQFKIGDQIEVSLVIRNSNPYPVKIPVYQKVTQSAVPLTNPRQTIYISWAMKYFEVEANSTRTTLMDRVRLRLPYYAKYWYVDGQQAFIEIEVAPN